MRESGGHKKIRKTWVGLEDKSSEVHREIRRTKAGQEKMSN
jgi:hypothetical protein